jgi:hypothetical protein
MDPLSSSSWASATAQGSTQNGELLDIVMEHSGAMAAFENFCRTTFNLESFLFLNSMKEFKSLA